MGRKILLEHENVPGIETLEVYRKMGGYRAAEKAIKSVVNKLITVTNKIDAIEKKAISNHTLYSVALALANENAEFVATLAAAEAEKDAMLQGLGLPGTSILA